MPCPGDTPRDRDALELRCACVLQAPRARQARQAVVPRAEYLGSATNQVCTCPSFSPATLILSHGNEAACHSVPVDN